MDARLTNRVAIVTGSGRGIGRAIALAMANEGALVVVNDWDSEVAEGVAAEVADAGGRAIAFHGDISKYEVARSLVQTAVDNFGGLDILVNNAGVSAPIPIWEMSEEDWDVSISVNLKGTFNCIRHACVVMKEKRWGRILNATSRARRGTWRNHCSYNAAKAGVVGLTKSLARDLEPFGVTCNAYGPAAATRMTVSEEGQGRAERAYRSGAMTRAEYELSQNPPSPDTIPPLLIYLCTAEVASISGQVFEIFGQDIFLYTEEARSQIHKEAGLWSVEELGYQVPRVLLERGQPRMKPGEDSK